MRAEQLIEAMERRLRGEAVGIGPFARLASPPAFDAEGLGKLGRFARREADGLLTLLDDPDPGARHAAAYLLGRSADARAVDPLFALTVAPQDWLDPDYAIEALGALGDVALPGLLTRALDRTRDAPGIVFLAVFTQHPAHVVVAGVRNPIRCTEPGQRIHAHIQRAILTKTEAALRIVELRA